MKIMLAGAIGAGKTTLKQRVLGQVIKYTKTQTTYLDAGFFDTPGEYLEHRHFKHALLITSYEADLVILVQAAIGGVKIQPGFASYFNRPVIGIVTKIDIATPDEISQAINSLKQAGVKEIFTVSPITEEGVSELVDRLKRGPDGNAEPANEI